ncbi:PilZ domain-containing protein [Christensenella intestinihominis]|uniref:PilZ domain-containing protein n=1 Tax=Christensenella intestinihominis TaxID=1851429 RepID=UPI0011CC8A77|nr:PilZ domain-containing protein [Christensenella intestinihominis]
MEGKIQKSIVRMGESIQIVLPDGETYKTKVQLAEKRYLWIQDSIREEQQETPGTFLTMLLVRGVKNVSFKAIFAGREIINGVSLLKFVAVTDPADDNRRESFRLYKLFDLSVSRLYGKPDAKPSVQCQGLDISDAGLGFASSQWFQFGEIIECRFSLADARYRLSAKVVRVIKQVTDAQEEVYRVGVRFIRAGDNTRKGIRRYIYLQQTARRKRMRKETDE